MPKSEDTGALARLLIAHCPLFTDCDEETLTAFFEENPPERERFAPGEDIPIGKNDTNRLAVVLSGRAIAYARDPVRTVILRTLPVGSPFGAAVLFSDEREVSLVRAKGESEILFLSPEQVLLLLEGDRAFLRRYLAFLSGRIRFLNHRIACYTAGSAERKLCFYLLSLKADENGTVELDLSFSGLSESLSLGRASLYRAIDRLTEEGLIEKDGHSLRIPDRAALERYGTEKP